MNARRMNWIRKASALALLLAPAAWSSPSIELTNFDGRQATVVGHDFTSDPSKPRSFQVNVYINDSFENSVNTGSNGSFSYTTPSGSVKGGDRLKVAVLNWKGSGNHYEKTFTLKGHAPAPDPMTDREISEYANQQARTVANRVAKTYGQLENWKYNFYEGYWDGIDSYGDLGRGRDYDEGYSSGSDQGRNQGYADGMQQGTRDGEAAGGAEAKSRFVAVVNTDREPNLNLDPVSEPFYGGLSSQITRSTRTEAAMSRYDSSLESELAALSWEDGGYRLRYENGEYRLRLSEISRGSRGGYRFTDSWFREEYAYEEWKANRLGGGYDYNLYNKMTESERSRFAGYFRQIYDGVIDEKFNRVKFARNGSARSRGFWYGREMATYIAYDRGYTHGYNKSYASASIPGYRAGFPAAYVAGFRSKANYYMNNPAILVSGVRLIDGNGNGAFELGERIGVVIGKVTNIGRVAAQNVVVQLTGASIDTIGSSSITIERSISRDVNQAVPDLAQIKMDVIADQRQAIKLRVGDQSSDLGFTVSWEGGIAALAELTNESSEAASLKKFIFENVKAEWTQNESAKNKDAYKPGNTSTKLARLVAAYERLPENKRGAIRAMGPELVNIQETHEHNKWSTGKMREEFKAMASRIQ